jgi:hypothetical protein
VRPCLSLAVSGLALVALALPVAGAARTKSKPPTVTQPQAQAAAETAAPQLLDPSSEQIVSIGACSKSLVLNRPRALYGCQMVKRRAIFGFTETICQRMVITGPFRLKHPILEPQAKVSVPFKKGYSLIAVEVEPDPAPPSGSGCS